MTRNLIVVSMVFFAAAANAVTPAFIGPDAFAIDGFPQSVAVADFDENGKPDLVVGGDQIFILLANGTGGFQPAVFVDAGPVSNAVAAADFDADGHTDIAVTSGGAISVLAGAGDGTFGAAQQTAVMAIPYLLRAANFNGDTLADLAVVSRDPDTELLTITVLIGQAGGGFTQTALIDGGEFDLGDFDGDATLDLIAAVANPAGLRLFLGNGDGTFADAGFRDIGASANAEYPRLVVAGRFNGDAHLDVIASTRNAEPEPRVILLGDGSGGFGLPAAIDSATTGSHLLAHDLDQDGDLDLIIPSTIDQHVTVVEGNGNGTFAPPVHFAAGFGPVHAAAADFDADGKPDVAVANVTGFSISLLRGDGAGGFTNSVRRPAFIATPPVTGDLDGDAHLDLASPSVNGTIQLLFGDGLGNFDRRATVPVGGIVRCVVISDLDQDGYLDLAASMAPDPALGPRGIALLFGDGSGTFPAPVLLPTAQMGGRATLIAADFNLDGRPDLAVTNVDASFVRGVQIFMNAGGGVFSGPVHYPNPPQANHLAAGDFDNDGILDLVTANLVPPSISILMGGGSGNFSAPGVMPLNAGATHVETGDLNGDGNTDIVTSSSSGAVVVLFGHGDSSFDLPVFFSADPGEAVAIADFNQDTKPDLAVTASGVPALDILLGDGTGAFTLPVQYPAGAQPLYMALGDFREDNRIDLAVTSARTLSLLLNVTGGENTPAAMNVIVQPVDTTTGTTPVTVTFGNVAGAGTTTLTTSSTGPAPPSGFVLGAPPVWFDLRTTASYTDNIQVCIHYASLGFTDESQLTLWHYEGGQWSNVTSLLDTVTDRVCGTVSSLSPFAVLAPQTAACTITTTLDAAKVRIGASADLRLDVRAEMFRNDILAGSGQIDGVRFQNDRLLTIPLQTLMPVGTCRGDTLAFTVSARNACSSSGQSTGTATLLYNEPSVDGYFRTASDAKYHLLANFVLGTKHGGGPRLSIDVPAGAPCSAYTSFGTWRVTLP